MTNHGTNVTLYAYDRAGQLTNEVCLTNGIAGGQTNRWVYDEAGNWLNAPQAGTKWVYNADNELIARANTADTNWSITVTGEVEPGPANNKWYNSWAECRGVRARVSTNTGLFSLPGVPLHGGSNELVVTVTDVSGNTYTTNRWVKKEAAEYFLYDGNGNLTNWVCGTTNWVYEWDWADRLVKVSSNGVVVLENWYDAYGRRLAKGEFVGGQTVKRMYVHGVWSVLGVLNDTAQLLETYTRGVGLTADIGTLVSVTHHTGSMTSGVFYLHHNHRGDVISARSGVSTVSSWEYWAFGTTRTASGPNLCRFHYSSKEWDTSAGLHHFGYRCYSSTWQRWINRDLIQEIGGWNLYKFVHNTPVTAIDPLGLAKSPSCVQDCQDAFGDADTMLGQLGAGAVTGFILDVLKEISHGAGIATDGGKLKELCRAGGLTKFGRWFRAAAIWSVLAELYNQAPAFYGLATCIALCPDVNCPPPPGAYYDGCSSRNGPPTTVVW